MNSECDRDLNSDRDGDPFRLLTTSRRDPEVGVQ